MPGRYEIVDEPSLDGGGSEAEDVYRPDQAERTPRIRTLEPIVAGPVSLKTVFMDPTWSPRQRRACTGLLMVTAVVCVAILISLLAGLAKVLSHISWMERMKEHGLSMVPDLEAMDYSSFIYSDNNYHMGTIFAHNINATVKKYEEGQEGKEYEDCKDRKTATEGHHCRFPIKNLLKGGCTSDNNFGYDNGKPCILFVFKHDQEWMPEDAGKKPKDWLNVTCDAAINGRAATELEYRKYPEDGFDTRFFRKGDGLGPNQDLYIAKPAVMVEFLNLDSGLESGLPLEVQCYLGSSRKEKLMPNTFYGVKVLDFDVRKQGDLFGR